MKAFPRIGTIIDLGADLGVIEKKGTWFSYGGNRLGQGREAVREELKKNPKLVDELEKAILAKAMDAKDVLPRENASAANAELAEV